MRKLVAALVAAAFISSAAEAADRDVCRTFNQAVDKAKSDFQSLNASALTEPGETPPSCAASRTLGGELSIFSCEWDYPATAASIGAAQVRASVMVQCMSALAASMEENAHLDVGPDEVGNQLSTTLAAIVRVPVVRSGRFSVGLKMISKVPAERWKP